MQMPCDVDKDSTIQHVTHSTEGVPDEAGNTEAENTGNHVNNEVDNGPLITDCISEENMAIVLTDLVHLVVVYIFVIRFCFVGVLGGP